MIVKWRFGDMKMNRKLLLSFIMLVSIPLVLMGYYSSVKYTQSIEQKTIAYSMKMQDSMMVRVDDYIEDMMSISSIPAYIDDLKQNLIRSNEYYAERQHDSLEPVMPDHFPQLLSIQRGIEGELGFINSIKRGANAVYLFDKYGNSYYSIASGGIRSHLDASYAYWLDKLEHSKGEAALLPTEKYISNLQSEKYAFTVVRKIMDRSLQPIGLIAIDANISVIDDQIAELDQVTKGKSLIVDQAGNVIYDSRKQLVASNLSTDETVKQARQWRGSFFHTEAGEQWLNIYSTSERTGWKVITSIPVSELTSETVAVRSVIWITTIIAVILSVAVAIVLSYAITKPLRRMASLMKRVQEGNFQVKFPVKYRDEVGLLGSQFNRMTVRLEQLIQDIYEMETKKNKAELQALQNQINPHFMYNTLESIRMSAEVNDDSSTADMIATLGKLLRYSISDLDGYTVLRDELQHVQHYVELLNYRYPDRFVLQCEVEQELLNRPVIKLMLQPVVENAIYHGLDERKSRMFISIRTVVSQHVVAIRIADNGIGIEPDRLAQLNEGLGNPRRFGVAPGPEGEGAKSGGIGLKNVNERIKLQYGPQYGLSVSSVPEEGTEVEILLPVERRAMRSG